VRMLNRAYPQARIELLVREYAAPIVRNQPGIADLVIWDPQVDASEFINSLAARNYDAVICLYPRPQLARAFARAKIPVRVGSGRRWYSFFFTHRVNVSRRKSGRHEKDLNLDLLAPVGIEPDYSLTPELSIPSEAGSSGPDDAKPLAGGNRDRPLAVVHPGDSGSAINWRIERYAELVPACPPSGIDTWPSLRPRSARRMYYRAARI
jgi:ADP-heptose:LPS heptosyltransferase